MRRLYGHLPSKASHADTSSQRLLSPLSIVGDFPVSELPGLIGTRNETGRCFSTRVVGGSATKGVADGTEFGYL